MRTILLISYSLLALSLSAQVKFNTGDTELDNDLAAINANAKLDISAFNADLTASFGVSSKNIEYMTSIKMEPAEMYFALELALAVNKPIETVVDTYEAHRDKGWGYIAQQLGIKPGSAEFHALKGKSKTKKESGKKSTITTEGNGNGQGNNGQRGNSSSSRRK